MLNKHVGAGPACPGAVDTHWNASVPKCGTLPKNAIFGKYVRRHLVSVEHRSFGLVQRVYSTSVKHPWAASYSINTSVHSAKSVPNCFTHSLYYFMFYPY